MSLQPSMASDCIWGYGLEPSTGYACGMTASTLQVLLEAQDAGRRTRIRTKVGRVMSRSLAKSWAALGQGKDHQKSRSHAVNAKTIRGACNNTHHLRNHFTFYFGHPKTYTQVIPPILADSAVEHQDFSCSTGCSFPAIASRIY